MADENENENEAGDAFDRLADGDTTALALFDAFTARLSMTIAGDIMSLPPEGYGRAVRWLRLNATASAASNRLMVDVGEAVREARARIGAAVAEAIAAGEDADEPPTAEAAWAVFREALEEHGMPGDDGGDEGSFGLPESAL